MVSSTKGEASGQFQGIVLDLVTTFTNNRLSNQACMTQILYYIKALMHQSLLYQLLLVE